MGSNTEFSSLVLAWYKQNGRQHLPWKKAGEPYFVWLSEIMLQQTQVNTVIPYFNKFISALPTINALATTEQDNVLSLWSGLGYYSRARNLHKAAQIITTEHNGFLPNNCSDLIKLPGIGKSTAHAILSLAYNQPKPILDGNVKRVLSRYAGIDGPVNQSKTIERLWQQAESLMPKVQCNDYSQAMMDIGSLICKRREPVCHQCPIAESCYANKHGAQNELPSPKPKRVLASKDCKLFLIIKDNNKVLLQRRPSKGVWGGLWTLPGSNESLFCPLPFRLPSVRLSHFTSFKHTFTHFHLNIDAYLLSDNDISNLTITSPDTLGYIPIKKALALGLPKPTRYLLEKVQQKLPTGS